MDIQYPHYNEARLVTQDQHSKEETHIHWHFDEEPDPPIKNIGPILAYSRIVMPDPLKSNTINYTQSCIVGAHFNS